MPTWGIEEGNDSACATASARWNGVKTAHPEPVRREIHANTLLWGSIRAASYNNSTLWGNADRRKRGENTTGRYLS